ncbi:hypothetical protein M569_05141 [Genlisea aurea]|uniref:Reverse transcriptase domain-containing protein n=1 Tax=Genlisea aurea TaxID=192259 RepID=S8CS33_9LAMI|nr:hypothetical protein M569_05141 [Genlisea aurea]
MSLFVWNCRGLRSASTVRRLREIISIEAPSIIFLSETKCMDSYIDWLKDHLSYFGVAVSAIGLALLWRKDVAVSLLSFCPSYIDVLVQFTANSVQWRFTGFYGHSVVTMRTLSWRTLRQLRLHSSKPWLVAGDFNKVTIPSEFDSAHLRAEPQMRSFRKALEDCELHDIGFSGFPFTWCNKRKYPDTVRARLDRAVATTPWSQLYPTALVKHLSHGPSDHLPLLIAAKRPSAEVGPFHQHQTLLLGEFRTGTLRFSMLRLLRNGRKTALFATSVPDQTYMDSILDVIPCTVTATMKATLERPYTAAETYWPVVGPATTNAVLKLLNHGIMEPGMNHSYIALIPKVADPQEPAQFRPISLSNVVYKIASKMVAIRIKPIMEKIVSKEQAAFFSGRSITGNILLAYEVNHSIKAARRGYSSYGALNLDVSKTFDRIEWPFLEKVLRRHGFPDSTIATIMLCVTSASYSILINGSPEGHVTPTRGIRQGDPISPYLFILCSDTLSRLLNEESVRNPDLGKINLEKSSLSIPSESDTHYKHLLSVAAGVPLADALGRYLGLPSLIGMSKKAAFRDLRDRIQNRIFHWHTKFLSKAGKIVLIKAVLQAISTYAMQCFRLPTTMITELNGLFSNFWWHDRGRPKMHLLAWNELCQPIIRGGLGFRNLAIFNKALLAKQCWRIFTRQELLISQLLKGKYFRNTSFLQAPLGRSPFIHMAQHSLGTGIIGFRRPDLSAHLLVSDLIDQNVSDWNRGLTCMVFKPATYLGLISDGQHHHEFLEAALENCPTAKDHPFCMEVMPAHSTDKNSPEAA